VRKDPPDRLGPQVPRDLREPLEAQVPPVREDPPALEANKVFLARMAQRLRKEQPAPRVSPETRDLRDSPDLRETRDSLGRQAQLPDPRETGARRATRATRESLGRLPRKEQPVLRDSREPRDLRETRETRDRKDLQEKRAVFL
jgi:hypothetical protein